MAKKKSKSQKQKQSIKRKAKVQQKKNSQVVPSSEVKYNVVLTEPQKYKSKKTQNKPNANQSNNKNTKQTQKKGKVVKNTDVLYNVVLTNNNKKPIIKTSEKKVNLEKKELKKFNIKELLSKIKLPKKKEESKKSVLKKKETTNKKSFNIKEFFHIQKKEKKEKIYSQDFIHTSKKKKVYSKNYVVKKTSGKKSGKIVESNQYTIERKKPKNIFLRLLYEIWTNMNVIFDTILILTFVLFLIGIIKIDVFKQNTIIYISGLIIFLMIIAISYNKHIEGWIFTLLLCAGMGFAIYQMQYTYDFINALNTSEYEMKTYYIVTFDNPTNRSLYNVSNKKVGILKDNEVNVERYLNTLIKTNYIEYDDVNEMFDDFYGQRLRAVIVMDNEYKYLENNIENNKTVKILYEFQVNGKK